MPWFGRKRRPHRASASRALPECPAHSQDHRKQEKILLVDDDVNFLDLAERLLSKEGYSPIATDAPESVLQIARTVRPAAIFLDIMMPGLNGWDVLATLRSDPVTAKIPVIMLSVMDDRQKALDLGASEVMTKPLESTQGARSHGRGEERVQAGRRKACGRVVQVDGRMR